MQGKSEGGNASEQLLWGRTLTFPQFRRGPLTARICGSRKRACFWLQAWSEGYIYFQSPTSFSLFSAFPHLCTSATSYLVPRGIIPNKKWLLTLRTFMSTKHLSIGIDLFDPHHSIMRLQGRCPAHLIDKEIKFEIKWFGPIFAKWQSPVRRSSLLISNMASFALGHFSVYYWMSTFKEHCILFKDLEQRFL